MEDVIFIILTYLSKKHNHCCALTHKGLVCSKRRKIAGYCIQHYIIIKEIIFKAYINGKGTSKLSSSKKCINKKEHAFKY